MAVEEKAAARGPSSGRPDRNLALELVRTTEYAALAAARWIGMGEKEAADQAAVDAMRLLLDTVSMDGTVVIGEGEKDEAPMLYNGERIGDGTPPEVDIAVDPLEGTELTAMGLPSALAVIALSERGSMFDPGPCVYMEKMATSRELAHLLDLDRPLAETLRLIAKEKGTDVRDVVVIMLDRPRHEDAVKEIRQAGARIRFIPHGDVSAALIAVTRGSPVDLLWGIGGTPEGVISAAAIKCIGGQILGRLWPRPGRGAPRRPARREREHLLRGHRRDRRRHAEGRALRGPRGRHDRVAEHALPLRHRPPGLRAARPREAAGDHRRAARLAAH
jgi:fructose-1,6-bisphosphatase II